ncbi:MAG: BTAD domain-containing putative transcriptional regulator [Acidimicrobiia bacterium]
MPGGWQGHELSVLGPMRIAGAPESLARQQQIVLAMLIARRGSYVSTPSLVDAVWGPTPPVDDQRRLAVIVSRLRRALLATAAGIDRSGDGFALIAPPGLIDADALATAAQPPTVGADGLRAALDLWRGPPFGGLAATVPALLPDAARLERLRDALVGRLHELELEHAAAGTDATVVAELAGWAEQRPTDEGAWLRLARAWARADNGVEAVRTLQRFRRQLAELTGTDPSPAVVELEQRLLGACSDALPLGGLVGRSGDVERILASLAERRIVTLVGPAGVGKTALAERVSSIAARRHPDGVVWCDLTAARDAERLDAVLASALGLDAHGQPARRRAALVHGLAARRQLVVLDNCEHVLDAVAHLVHDIAERCLHVVVLATSRQPLAVAGERIERIEPLGMDDAVRLFVVRCADGGVTVEPDEAVERLCARLDGLPLALELAASRMATSTASELLGALDGGLAVLRRRAVVGVAERHTTLASAIGWSHELLDPAEQRLFAELSCFRGSFDREAVSGVFAAPVEVLESLVAKSLVVAERNAIGVRFRLLDSLRSFAAERLERSGRTQNCRDRHAGWYVALAEGIDREGRGPLDRRWHARVPLELPDLRAAFDRCIERNDAAAAQALTAGLFVVTVFRGVLLETSADWAYRAVQLDPSGITRWTASALAAATWGAFTTSDDARAEVLAKRALAAARNGPFDDGSAANIVCCLATFVPGRGPRDRDRPVADAELAAAAASGDVERLARAWFYSNYTRRSAERTDAIRASQRARELAEETGSVALRAMTQTGLGQLLLFADLDLAEDALHSARALAEEAGSLVMHAHADHTLGIVWTRRGDDRRAIEHHRAGLRRWRFQGDARTWWALQLIAECFVRLGAIEPAAVLHAAIGSRPLGRHSPHDPSTVTAAVATLPADVRRRAERLGRTLDEDQAIRFALDQG